MRRMDVLDRRVLSRVSPAVVRTLLLLALGFGVLAMVLGWVAVAEGGPVWPAADFHRRRHHRRDGHGRLTDRSDTPEGGARRASPSALAVAQRGVPCAASTAFAAARPGDPATPPTGAVPAPLTNSPRTGVR